ncbi:putative ribonuclease H protein [Sesamum angolense]|uniref:Ribonuclease H protein n=1 Tax=Sesamum angolense TaxID=2727404 RepID=A0AAE1T516_9LAMI|nr:putative ribonuclease H protein [Sesamum angolense]
MLDGILLQLAKSKSTSCWCRGWNNVILEGDCWTLVTKMNDDSKDLSSTGPRRLEDPSNSMKGYLLIIEDPSGQGLKKEPFFVTFVLDRSRGVPFSTDSIIHEVQRHLRTLYAARTLTSTQWKGDLHRAAIMGFIFRRQVPRAPSIVRWHAPSPSWFKLNTDGSSLGNPGLAGAAGIIRDSASHVHLAYQFALGIGTSVLAELTVVWRGMELALTHGLTPLVVEVDATTLLVADVQHVFRETNGAADHLAKEAASLQLTRVLHHDDITGILRGIPCLDRQGVPHLR